MRPVAIIGAGKVGCNLAIFFQERALPLAALVDPFADPSLLPPRLRPLHSASLDAIPPDAGTVLIAVPDGAIASVAQDLARLTFGPDTQLVAHCSGLRSSDDLLPLAGSSLGGSCLAGSMHPVQSFNSRDIGSEKLRGIGCGIEGGDAFAAAAAAFASSLGWHPLRIRKERKALYHAACVLAGNLSMALIADARALLCSAASDEAATGDMAGAAGEEPATFFEPMLREVLARAETVPFAEALSGPLARGDSAALAAHLAAIRDHAPGTAALYEALLARVRELLRAE